MKGQYKTALTYYEKAFKIDLNNYGPESSKVAVVYNNIGNTVNIILICSNIY